MSHPYASRPNAGTHDWLTPPEIVRALGAFDLDPCAASGQPWPTASRMIAPPDDGLIARWDGRIWLNPPYGQHTAAWLGRMAEHGDGVALVFARTETAMFQRFVWPHADALLFMAKRPHFHRPDGTRAAGNSGGPMVLIAYGVHNVAALQRSGIDGALVMPVARRSAA